MRFHIFVASIILIALMTSCSKVTSNMADIEPTNTGCSLNKKAEESVKPTKIGWDFTFFEETETNPPYTEVSIVVDGKKTKLKECDGEMHEMSKVNYKVNEIPAEALLAAMSWYGGGGDYIYVTKNDDQTLKVMWRFIESPEEGESEEEYKLNHPDFSELFSVKISNTKDIEIDKTNNSVVPSIDMFFKFVRSIDNITQIPRTEVSILVVDSEPKEYRLNEYAGSLEVIIQEEYGKFRIPKEALLAAGTCRGGAGDFIYIIKNDDKSLKVMWGYFDPEGEGNPVYKEILVIPVSNANNYHFSPSIEETKGE